MIPSLSKQMTTTYQTIKEGFFFRVIGSDGFKSMMFTSQAQADLYAIRKSGKRVRLGKVSILGR